MLPIEVATAGQIGEGRAIDREVVAPLRERAHVCGDHRRGGVRSQQQPTGSAHDESLAVVAVSEMTARVGASYCFSGPAVTVRLRKCATVPGPIQSATAPLAFAPD